MPTSGHLEDYINGLTEETTPDTTNDMLLIRDATDGSLKKIAPDNLPGGAGGAPTDAKYVVSAANGSLSNEIIIPGIAAHADAPANFPSLATAYEFDTSSTVLTWTPSDPAVIDSNTTILSHLYMKFTDNTERLGLVAWSPAGAFDARAKLLIGADYDAVSYGIGLLITDSDNSERLLCNLAFDDTLTPDMATANAYTYTSSSYTQRGVKIGVASNEIYVRITRDGSNNISFYWSTNGILWQLIATQNFSLTVANIGLRFASSVNSQTTYGAVDWIRANV